MDATTKGEDTFKRRGLKMKHVDRFMDRLGQARYYFRIGKGERTKLPGSPFSEEFHAAYKALLRGEAPVTATMQPAERAASPHSFKAALTRYLHSAAFKKLTGDTPYRRKIALEAFAAAPAADGKQRGDCRVDTLTRKRLAEILDQHPSRHSAVALLKALKHMYAFLRTQDLDEDADPTIGCKTTLPAATDGFYTWTEDDIAAYEAKYPVHTKERLALALLLNTGLRRQDVIKLGPQHLTGGYVRFTPKKTDKGQKPFKLNMAITDELERVLKAHRPFKQLTCLLNGNGDPFSPTRFSQFMRKACDAAGLQECSAHGLRKAIAVRLADNGCDVRQIAAITGHKNWKVLQLYIAEANGKVAADIATSKLNRRKAGRRAS